MRLTTQARALVALAATILLGMFATPLWSIRLVAPQYPEGLSILIRINTVVGLTPTDLGNINELNHYIGMKVIEPSAIAALRIMPWVLGALALAGFVVAIAGRRALAVAWLAAFAAAAVAGLGEFWRWEYDYGHHIDFEHAIIKVPGMSYEPPLIGSRQLLNFTATSWPSVGAYLAAAAFVLALAALWISRERSARAVASVPAMVPRYS